MYVARDHKDWDTYLPSATYVYNTSLSKTTGDTPFFLTYGREPVKLPDVALLPPPLIRSNAVVVDYHRERLIRQIRTARQLAADCTQQAQKRMKLYYDQHVKDHPFKVSHKFWIYNYAVKPSLSKKLCSLWHGPFRLVDEVTPVSFKVCNLQGKLQKGLVLVNRMKQYFSYDDPPIDPPPQSNSPGNSPNLTPVSQNLFTELLATEDTKRVQDNFPDTSCNVATDHVDNLEEIQPSPDLTETQGQQQKIKDIHNIANQLDIITNTLPN